jgi:hypothetical protein
MNRPGPNEAELLILKRLSAVAANVAKIKKTVLFSKYNSSTLGLGTGEAPAGSLLSVPYSRNESELVPSGLFNNNVRETPQNIARRELRNRNLKNGLKKYLKGGLRTRRGRRGSRRSRSGSRSTRRGSRRK